MSQSITRIKRKQVRMTGSDLQHPVPAMSRMTLDGETPVNASGQPQDGHVQRGEQIVNPFEIVAVDEYGIDYDKLIDNFGTRRIDQAILDRFEKLTGHKPHHYLRRGLFFSQR